LRSLRPAASPMERINRDTPVPLSSDPGLELQESSAEVEALERSHGCREPEDADAGYERVPTHGDSSSEHPQGADSMCRVEEEQTHLRVHVPVCHRLKGLQPERQVRRGVKLIDESGIVKSDCASETSKHPPTECRGGVRVAPIIHKPVMLPVGEAADFFNQRGHRAKTPAPLDLP
jgi:hypothetical protein